MSALLNGGAAGGDATSGGASGGGIGGLMQQLQGMFVGQPTQPMSPSGGGLAGVMNVAGGGNTAQPQSQPQAQSGPGMMGIGDLIHQHLSQGGQLDVSGMHPGLFGALSGIMNGPTAGGMMASDPQPSVGPAASMGGGTVRPRAMMGIS